MVKPFNETMLSRKIIIATLANDLSTSPFISAMWESGAIAFNRVDEWSDIDIHLLGNKENVAQIFTEVERCLSLLSSIEDKYIVPLPGWHGHYQTFYRLADLNKFQVVDCAVIDRNQSNKFLEPEIYGNLIIHFDKTDLFKGDHHLNRELFDDILNQRVKEVEHRFIFFQFLIEKEINRKNYIEAFEFYYRFTIEPLIELLRIKYYPLHYNFKTRYIYYDLPEEIVKQLEPLFFVHNTSAFQRLRLVAQMFFYDTLEALKINTIYN